jgi:hypothetical protein
MWRPVERNECPSLQKAEEENTPFPFPMNSFFATIIYPQLFNLNCCVALA